MLSGRPGSFMRWLGGHSGRRAGDRSRRSGREFYANGIGVAQSDPNDGAEGPRPRRGHCEHVLTIPNGVEHRWLGGIGGRAPHTRDEALGEVRGQRYLCGRLKPHSPGSVLPARVDLHDEAAGPHTLESRVVLSAQPSRHGRGRRGRDRPAAWIQGRVADASAQEAGACESYAGRKVHGQASGRLTDRVSAAGAPARQRTGHSLPPLKLEPSPTVRPPSTRPPAANAG